MRGTTNRRSNKPFQKRGEVIFLLHSIKYQGNMMMPPESRYTRNKKLCNGRYYLHRWVIGYDDVDVAKFPGQSSDNHELSEWKKSYIFSFRPYSYIETFLEIRKTGIIFLKSIEYDCMSLLLKCLCRL
jgi:hypothetical protein